MSVERRNESVKFYCSGNLCSALKNIIKLVFIAIMSLVIVTPVLAQISGEPLPVKIVNQGSGTRDAIRQLERNLLPAIAAGDSNVIKAIGNASIEISGQLSRLNDNLELQRIQNEQSADWDWWGKVLLGLVIGILAGILLIGVYYLSRDYSSRRGSLPDEVFVENEELTDNNSAFATDNAIAVKTGNNSPVTINQFGRDIVPVIIEETLLVFISDKSATPADSSTEEKKEKSDVSQEASNQS